MVPIPCQHQEGGYPSAVSIEIPEDSAGKTLHVICEVRDDGVPNLTSYRRIIVAAQAPTPTPEELEK
jgi:hypothetical protein